MAEGDGGCTAAAVKSMEQPRRRMPHGCATCIASGAVTDGATLPRRLAVTTSRILVFPVTTTILLSLFHRSTIKLLFLKHTHSPLVVVYIMYLYIGNRWLSSTVNVTSSYLYSVIIYHLTVT